MERREFFATIAAGIGMASSERPEPLVLKKGSVLRVTYTGTISPLQRKIIDSFTSPLSFEEWHREYGDKSW